MKKLYYLAVIVCMGMLMSGCATQNLGFLRGDVIGFSEGASTSYNASKGVFKNWKKQNDPFDLTLPEDVEAMNAYIKNDIPRGSNTAAYYAVELACDRIRYIRTHYAWGDKKTKYYIFLLTDGLDNNSTQAAQNDGQTWFKVSADKYPKRLQRKLRWAMGFQRNLFEVYPMLYEGDDIRAIMEENNLDSVAYRNFLKSKMDCFRYSSNGVAPELVLANDYQKIFADMQERFISSAYEFRIPKSFAGKKVRMMFTSKNGEKSELIGDFVKRGATFQLENVQFEGMTVSMDNSVFMRNHGNTLKAVHQQDSTNSNVFFRLEEMRRDNKAFVVGNGPKDVRQYYQDNGLWIVNSEYNTEQFVTLDTYFVLVIDGSKSLDGQNGNMTEFEMETGMASDIIEMILNPKADK